MFAWETAKAHQASLLEIFPDVFCQPAPAAQRLATAFGEAAPKQKKEDRPPAEPRPVERNKPAEPKTNFVANPKANQDPQRTDPKEPVEPKANFMANPKTNPDAAGTPRMSKRSQSLPRTTGRNTLTLSAQADREKNKREKDAMGRPPFVPPGNPGVRVPRPDGAIREDLRRCEHERQQRSQSVQNRGVWAVPSPKYEKPASAIETLVTEALAKEQGKPTNLELEWGADIHAKPNEDERLKQIQQEEEKKRSNAKGMKRNLVRRRWKKKSRRRINKKKKKKKPERKKQQEESCRTSLEEEEKKEKKQQEEEAARQRQQAADGKPNADDKGQPAVRDNNSNEATAKNEGLATSADTVPSASDSEPPVPPTSSNGVNPLTDPGTYKGFMTVCRLHEHYLLENEGNVIQIPQNPEDIVIGAKPFLPETQAATFAVWQSPEVSGGQALATAERIIKEFPTGKPRDLIRNPRRYLDWVEGVTEIYTREVTLRPNMLGLGLEVDVETGKKAWGILPRYIPKSAFRDEWQVCQHFKLKYGDMVVPEGFVFPSSRTASEESM